jgi:ABC-type transport system involved in multi-copper enzyme maturation permease subunit
MFEFNPVLVKELRGRMRGARAFVLLTIYLAILSLVTLLLYTALAETAGTDLNAGRQIGKGLFLVTAAVALIEVCIITPSLTAGSIAGEKERQTYDLLIASLLTPWQIVWGKLAAALAFALLMILAILPVMSLAFLFGGVSLAEVLIALVGLVSTAVFYAAVGLFWSSIMRSTLGATSFALGSIILMLLGVPFLAVIFTLIFGSGNTAEWTRSAVFVYLGGAFISTHPFIALGTTEVLLSSGENPFFSVVDPGGANVLVPAPWIAYVLLSVLFTTLLILLSVRMLHPAQYDQPRAEDHPRGDAEEGAS